MRIDVLPDALCPAAIALWHETGLTRPWNDPAADLRRALEGPTSTVLAAVDEGGALWGTAMVGHDGHRGWLYYVAVVPGRQGQGVGRSLVQTGETWLGERDVPKVQLMVRRTNAPVVAFYEQQGYVDQDVVVLGRFLT